MATFESIDHLLATLSSSGERPQEHSNWLEVTQSRVDAFAVTTNDSQWIHTDQERAAAGPHGGTIAHGFLTLSLIPFLTAGTIEVMGTSMQINYGLDRVRFVAPVRVGSRLRASTTILSAEQNTRGALARLQITMSIEGQQKPAVVAEQLVLLVAESAT